MKVDPELEQKQIAALKKVRATRNAKAVDDSLRRLKDTAQRGENIVEPVITAVENYATIGEISDVFREVWGEYHESA